MDEQEPTFIVEIPVRLACRLDAAVGHLVSLQRKKLRHAKRKAPDDMTNRGPLVEINEQNLASAQELLSLVHGVTKPVMAAKNAGETVHDSLGSVDRVRICLAALDASGASDFRTFSISARYGAGDDCFAHARFSMADVPDEGAVLMAGRQIGMIWGSSILAAEAIGKKYGVPASRILGISEEFCESYIHEVSLDGHPASAVLIQRPAEEENDDVS